MTRSRMLWPLAAAVLLGGSYCSWELIAGDGGAVSRRTIDRLEARALALARTEGCDRSSDCRVAPVGSKACGGPRYYLVYCARTTDTVALFATLRELERVEREYNRRAGIYSECMFVSPPGGVAVDGVCRDVNGPQYPYGPYGP